MFLLAALGGDFDLIFADHIASSKYNSWLVERIINRLNKEGQNGEIIRPLMEVKKEYLDAALMEISENHGNLNSFVTDTLKADTDILRERFLQRADSP